MEVGCERRAPAALTPRKRPGGHCNITMDLNEETWIGLIRTSEHDNEP